MDSGRGVPDGTDNDSVPVNTPNAGPAVETQPPASGLLSWKPNDSFLLSLTSMGISPVAAKKALYYTKNSSTEAAIEWIFENQEADLETPLEIELQRDPQNLQDQGSGSSFIQSSLASLANEYEGEDDLYKMVFVVNAELSMGVGKIAAQVAHAALGLHRILLQHQIKYGECLLNWTEYGETKIVLRGDTTEHLIDLEHKAIEDKLPCYLVHDAGKTQVKSGSTTVLAIFGPNKRVDRVTGSLKLY